MTKLSDTKDPQYYHKVVDCQYACPAHTPVPLYIRLIAEERYTEAYLVNRESNVFPGILGRVCDRPCEPACRRGRVDDKPVAICRLKRLAADLKSKDIEKFLPKIPNKKNGKKIALIGAGPASLTVVNDLIPLGYQCTLFEKNSKPGGAMLSQVPGFRLPESVLNEEIDMILKRGGVETFYKKEIKSLSALTSKYDAIFIGSGSPQGRKLALKGSEKVSEGILVGVEFLANVTFKHPSQLSEDVLVIGGGNTAMDCGRTAKRLSAKNVQIVAPEAFEDMLASPWEVEDAQNEQIKFQNHLLPMEYLSKDGKLTGVKFQQLKQCYDSSGKWHPIPSDKPDIEISCQTVILAIGQNTTLPFIDADLKMKYESNETGKATSLLAVDSKHQTSNPKVFIGGDAAWGPKNIITAVAHGHKAALSIHAFCSGDISLAEKKNTMELTSQRMNLNQWQYENSFSSSRRQLVPHENIEHRFKNINLEVEKGFNAILGEAEALRCLNCDIQTVFDEPLCIECDACLDICPVACLAITEEKNEDELKASLREPFLNKTQNFFIASVPKTKKLMLKDENLCLHCGLCAERCPTGAWDMQEFNLKLPQAKDI